MRKKINTVSLVVLSITLLFSTLQWSAAAYVPPTTYGKPENVAAVFNEDGGDGRWSFDLGLSASPEIRALLASVEDGSFEAAGYDSLGVSVLGDFRLDGGAWRSSMSDYDEWVNPQDPGFNAAENVWVGNWHIYEAYFEGIIAEEALQGENDYFDQHELEFRLRFTVSFYHSESGESYAYESPWSEVVSYSNSQEVYDPSSLIAHVPELTSVELKEHDDGSPYLIFQAKQIHDDIAMLNSISNQRVYTNVWIRVDNGAWTDVGSYMFLKESFEVDAQDYFGELGIYAQAKYEAKFRYTFDYSFYPAAGKSGEIASPYSNVISAGMPAFEGASSWAVSELEKGANYGLITERIKRNMAQNVTREEFAEIAVKLYEAHTGKTATVGSASFVDTTNPEILKAANLGLVTGVGNNKYDPSALVTREQMATILLRALQVIAPDTNYSNEGAQAFGDDLSISSWARNGVYYCAKAGIVNGVGNQKFNPKGSASREMAVIVCTRAMEALTD